MESSVIAIPSYFRRAGEIVSINALECFLEWLLIVPVLQFSLPYVLIAVYSAIKHLLTSSYCLCSEQRCWYICLYPRYSVRDFTLLLIVFSHDIFWCEKYRWLSYPNNTSGFTSIEPMAALLFCQCGRLLLALAVGTLLWNKYFQREDSNTKTMRLNITTKQQTQALQTQRGTAALLRPLSYYATFTTACLSPLNRQSQLYAWDSKDDDAEDATSTAETGSSKARKSLPVSRHRFSCWSSLLRYRLINMFPLSIKYISLCIYGVNFTLSPDGAGATLFWDRPA